MRAKPEIILMLSKRDKCWQCKHRFERPVLLPVEKPVPGKFQPNINVEVLFHVSETHGIPPDILREQIIGAVYGQELTEFGVKLTDQLSKAKEQ